MHVAYFILIYKQDHRQKGCLSLEYVAWLSFKNRDRECCITVTLKRVERGPVTT